MTTRGRCFATKFSPPCSLRRVSSKKKNPPNKNPRRRGATKRSIRLWTGNFPPKWEPIRSWKRPPRTCSVPGKSLVGKFPRPRWRREAANRWTVSRHTSVITTRTSPRRGNSDIRWPTFSRTINFRNSPVPWEIPWTNRTTTRETCSAASGEKKSPKLQNFYE